MNNNKMTACGFQAWLDGADLGTRRLLIRSALDSGPRRIIALAASVARHLSEASNLFQL